MHIYYRWKIESINWMNNALRSLSESLSHRYPNRLVWLGSHILCINIFNLKNNKLIISALI